MTEAIQAWMKSDEGRESVSYVVQLSKGGAKSVPINYDFPSVNVGINVGHGFKANLNGGIETLTGLTEVKVVLHPDGLGGFILKSAFPTM